MQRDPALHALTSDHHHALVLARRIGQNHAAGASGRELAQLLEEPWPTSLERELFPVCERRLDGLTLAGVARP